MLADLKIVLRQARRTPGFVVAAVLTLALGIGANTAIFSVINGFLRPLPVPDADQIVIIANTDSGDETGMRYRFSFPALQDYRARATSVFSDIFGFDIRIGGLSVNGKTSPFVYQMVTGNLFAGLHLQPAAGRLFQPGEGETVGTESVLVLAHAFWMRRFGGDTSIVGTSVRFDGTPVRIVGVAPPGFRGMVDAAEMDGFATIDATPRYGRTAEQVFTDRGSHPLTMVARLRPGVSVEQAQSVVNVLASQLADEHPETDKDTTARVVPEPQARPIPLASLTTLLPLVRFMLYVLSTVVLLIACMNVANLLLVRATVREREMAVRASLGATRMRLIRLLLTESLMLAILGAGLGITLGQVMNWLFVNSIDLGTDLAFKFDAHFDWRVFAYAGVTSLATGLIVGALPARKASRATVTGLLHDGGRTGSAGVARQRVRQGLVIAQVAGSLILLIVAGLCVRNLSVAQQVNLGFTPDHVMTVRLNTLDVGMDIPRSTAFYDEVDRRVRNLPGVESSSMSFSLPLGWIFGGYQARAEGDASTEDTRLPSIGTNSISPDYLQTLGIAMAEGRAFTSGDTQTSRRVAIVNDTLAERFWPKQVAIGKRLEIPSLPGPLWEVVGIAKTTKYLAVFEHPLPYIYLPLQQNPAFLRTLQVRSTAPMAETATQIERVIVGLEPDLPIADMKPLGEIVGGNLGFVLFRVGAWQASAMGTLGLLLAVIGVYGVVSYQTAQRAKEIGIRMALGAEPADVRRLVLRQGVWLVLSGVGLGLVLTLTLTAGLRRVLVLVSATDPITFVAVPLLLAAAALAACYLPARRATRVQPVEALRHE